MAGRFRKFIEDEVVRVIYVVIKVVLWGKVKYEYCLPLCCTMQNFRLSLPRHHCSRSA